MSTAPRENVTSERRRRRVNLNQDLARKNCVSVVTKQRRRGDSVGCEFRSLGIGLTKPT